MTSRMKEFQKKKKKNVVNAVSTTETLSQKNKYSIYGSKRWLKFSNTVKAIDNHHIASVSDLASKLKTLGTKLLIIIF